MKYFDNLKEWKKVKFDFENSGLSVKKYCDLKGISKSTFYRNINALKDSNYMNLNTYPDKIIIYINGNKVEFDPTIDDITLARIIKSYSK